MKQFIIASFYKFTPIPAFEALKDPILNCLKQNHLLGTVILASEGINGSISGKPENLQRFYDFIHQIKDFSDLKFKENFDDILPFDKAKVKFRQEIVTMGVEGVDPLKTPGKHVSPKEWNALIADPETLVIDTRNDYEVGLGTFENAINPNTKNFREFPEYVQKELLDKKDKKIAMFCTGGIRCEKSTAYLKNLGFENVYQLDLSLIHI